MPFFTTKALRERSQRLAKGASFELREAASERGSYTIFLSHSFRDADVIRGLRQEILEMGFSVYVDWVDDPLLDRSNVTRETAVALRERMGRCKAMLYATSPNAARSRWMPWEAGYFVSPRVSPQRSRHGASEAGPEPDVRRAGARGAA